MTNVENNWNALYNPTIGLSDLPGNNAKKETKNFLSNTLPISKLELSISARNLLNMDVISKSDPQCIVYMKDTTLGQDFFEIGRTEQIRDNLNPDFVHKITVDYNFEKVQYLKFEFWDIDINENDYLGEAITTLPEIVANKSRQFVRPIKNLKKTKKDCGKLIVVCEEQTASKQIGKFKFRCNNLKCSSCFSLLIKPSTFLKISRTNEDGNFTVVYESKVKWYTRSPQFDPFEIKMRLLCNSDLDRTIRIDVMEHNVNGDHKLIGSVFSSVNQLMNKDNSNKYEIKSKSKKIKGELELQAISLSDSYSFFDYLKGGLEVNFAVAIDCTSSNGPVDQPSSLHYCDPSNMRPNSYEIALSSVGNIIQYYNSTKMFAGFGFGAKVPPANIVSHRFALNGIMESPYCEGVDGLLFHYKNTIRNVYLYGPTNFAPIISYTADIASKNKMSKNYFILLIITDGVICDMEETKRSIIRAAITPMSIIIVGVGSADFSAMHELDSDEEPLQIDGRYASRDIVQFVSLKNYLKRDGTITNMGDLARDVLYEVPEQVEAYMKLHSIKPGFKRTSVDFD